MDAGGVPLVTVICGREVGFHLHFKRSSAELRTRPRPCPQRRFTRTCRAHASEK